MYTTLISPDDLKLLLDQHPDVVVVDTRHSLAATGWGREQYQVGHLPGAIYAHLDQDLSAPVIPGVTGRHPLPDAGTFNSWVSEHGIADDTQVIVYDQGGGSIAARLWWLLRWIGHDAVAVLDGGYPAWQHAGYAVTTEVLHPAPVRHTLRPHPEMTVLADELKSWCHDPAHRIVDSRAAKRYSGDEEPIDPVAGHIPGAVNLPFAENLNADGTWKSPDALNMRFASLAETCHTDQIAFYCGSGVTACHNVLAFCHAGLGNARLYPGSWSEWITDLGRGVEIS